MDFHRQPGMLTFYAGSGWRLATEGSRRSGAAAGRWGRPRSLALDSAEPVASAGGIRVSQSACFSAPPGKSEPAAPGWRIRATALLACSLARPSPNARRPCRDAATDGCGMPRETGDYRQAPRRQFANTLAGAGRQRGRARSRTRIRPRDPRGQRSTTAGERVCREADRSPASGAPAPGRRVDGGARPTVVVDARRPALRIESCPYADHC